MAEQVVAQHAVNHPLSMDGSPSLDVHAHDTTAALAANGAFPLRTTSSIDSNSLSQAPAVQATTSDPSSTLPEPLTNGSSTPSLDAIGANGEAGQFVVDDSGQAYLVNDGAASSDTDTSRTDSVEHTREGSTGVVRGSAVKRPAFKSVSVTKSFLAKTATASPVAKSAADNAASPGSLSAGLSAIKPKRLVAKTLKDTLPKSGKFQDGSQIPDASKVWNKNRPTPPAPPKQFTDEELKQQYGIHMATRLQAEDANKEGKWADIDDDEDDWAPETVEWVDGSKSTVIAPAEPAKPQETSQTPPPQDSAPEQNKFPPSSAGQPSISGGPKTILKPGSTAIMKPGVVLRSPLENKAVPNDKTAAPVPAKSPWASLPPVDKVSPVVINPDVQQQQQQYSRFAPQHNQHGFDGMPRQPSPTREMAADDFDRSWGQDRGPRELFNSQSGRYEPVRDYGRRDSRQEHYRHPSLLQRGGPAGPGGLSGPAEPSAAFQTSRSSGPMEGGFRARRGSNVSGEYERYGGRRMSFGRPSGSIGSEDKDAGMHRGPPASATPDSMPSPAQSRAGLYQPAGPHGWQRSGSNAVESPSTEAQPPFADAQHAAPPGEAPPSMHDQVAIQQKIMREKRELAMKRRREEEEKEEAAKKERIRLKMEALGLAPLEDKKADQTEEKPAATASTTAIEPPKQEKLVMSTSPPKPPIPTSAGEVAQYGMMKVHGPQTTLKRVPAKDEHMSMPGQPAPHAQEQQSPPMSKPDQGPQRATQHSHESPKSSTADDVQKGNTQHHAQTQQRGWKSPVAAQAYPGWSASGVPSHAGTRNVWGPPSLDRGLGNGTFVAGYDPLQPNRLSSPPATSQAPAPGPIAPPVTRAPPPDTSAQQPQRPGQQANRFVIDRDRAQAAFESAAPHDQQSKPAGPPADTQSQHAPKFGYTPWSDSPARYQDLQRHLQDDRRRPETHERGYPGFKAGFQRGGEDDEPATKAALADSRMAPMQFEQGQRSNVNTLVSEPASSASMTKSLSSGPGREGLAASQHAPSADLGPKSLSSGPATAASRMSRFFPSAPLGDRPPEEEDHPAFDGDVKAPVVSLPVIARVRLPPPARSPEPPTAAVAPATASVPARQPLLGAQPIVQNLDWQARINDLFGRAKPTSPSPPKPHAIAITSASKAPLDQPQQPRSATVSLPAGLATPGRATFTFIVDGSSSPISKSTEEELHQDREFGSLPVVTIPRPPYVNAHHPMPTRPIPRYMVPVDIYSVAPVLDSLMLTEYIQNQGYSIPISLPGRSARRTSRILRSKRHDARRPMTSFKQHTGPPHHSKPLRPFSREHTPASPSAKMTPTRAPSNTASTSVSAPGANVGTPSKPSPNISPVAATGSKGPHNGSLANAKTRGGRFPRGGGGLSSRNSSAPTTPAPATTPQK